MQNIADVYSPADRPVRVLQYGEGNFLRAFADVMIDIANERGVFGGDIAIVKPIRGGSLDAFARQRNLYTVRLRGLRDGQPYTEDRVVTSVADAVDAYADYARYAAYARLDSLRFILSNTTEAGIVYSETDSLDMCPPESFPGKLTKLLWERCEHFGYDPQKGVTILPVELIDDNGAILRDCVVRLARRWGLGERFLAWLDTACAFASTLVDRIVTGFPTGGEADAFAQLGYEDRLIVCAEPFALWVIEQPPGAARLPLDEAGLPVQYVADHHPYKQRKVRILNGAHTSFALAAFLAGHETVLQAVSDPLTGDFLRGVIDDEILPTLPLPREELQAFAAAVLERFANPFVAHRLLSIALNSVSKWRARCLPSLLAYYEANAALPPRLTFSLAALLAFYTTDAAPDGTPYQPADDGDVLAFFAAHRGDDPAALARAALSGEAFWGRDLTQIPGLADAVAACLADIRAQGMRGAMQARFGRAAGEA